MGTAESVINSWLDRLVQTEENNLEFRLRCATHFQHDACFLLDQFENLEKQNHTYKYKNHKANSTEAPIHFLSNSADKRKELEKILQKERESHTQMFETG